MQATSAARLWLAFLCIIFSATGIQAQNAENELHLKLIYPSTKVYLNAKIRELKATETYFINIPEFAANDASKTTVILNSEAKLSKKKETADYIFDVITAGVKQFTLSPPTYITGKVKTNMALQPEVSVAGFVRTAHYHFPLKIEVRNKAGELQKTIVVIDENEELTDVYHVDYLREPTFEERTCVTTINPFDSEAETTLGDKPEQMQELKTKIVQRAALNRWAMATPLVSKALNTAFGNEKIPSLTYAMYDIADPQPEYATLAALVERNKKAITSLGDKDKSAAGVEELKKIVAAYEDILKSTLNHNVKALLLINACQSALLSDQIEKSVILFKEYRLIDGSTAVQSAYEATLPNFYYRGLMTDPNADIIKLHEAAAGLK
jgi:hypothetical protein